MTRSSTHTVVGAILAIAVDTDTLTVRTIAMSNYDLGYFEGVRNTLMAYISLGPSETFSEWVNEELKNAKALRDRWDNDEED